MRFIKDLTEGERINEIYLCRKKQSALTKAGKPYESLMLQDKTGTLDAKIWEPSSMGIDDYDELDYIFPGRIPVKYQETARCAGGRIHTGGLSSVF